MGEITIYIKNIKLNFLDYYYMFYDWLSSDDIKTYSKVKTMRVNSKTIQDLKEYKVELLDNNNDNIMVFSDLQNSIAVEFYKNKSISKSSLQLVEEKTVIDKLINSKNEVLKYKKISKDKRPTCLRITEDIKKVISIELRTLIKINDTDKIKYLYYEWFGKKENNLNKMISRMQGRLKNSISNEERKIYEIIKISYKCV